MDGVCALVAELKRCGSHFFCQETETELASIGLASWREQAEVEAICALIAGGRQGGVYFCTNDGSGSGRLASLLEQQAEYRKRFRGVGAYLEQSRWVARCVQQQHWAARRLKQQCWAKRRQEHARRVVISDLYIQLGVLL